MKKKYKNLTSFEKKSLFVTNLFFLWTSFDFIGWFKIWLGADASQYSLYIKYFIEGPVSIGYEQGVHYFWFLSLIVRPIWLGAVTSTFNFWDTWAYHLGVLLGNTFVFLLLVNVTFMLFKKLFTNRWVSILALWNFLLLTPVYYSRLLVKPDLLTILLFVIFLYVLLEEKVFLNDNSKSFIPFAILFGYMLSTKFTVSVISLFVLFGYLIVQNKNEYSYRKIIFFFLIALLLATALIIHSETMTERYVWETPRAEPNYESAPLEYFTNFSLIETYENPLRDNLKGSFLSIWLADFYGDYWEVYFLSKNSALDLSETKILWARICFILSFLANLAYFASLVYKLKNRIIKNFDGALFSIYFLIAPISLIIISTILEWFKSSEGDPTKTTYFGFLFIFFIISIFSFLDVTWDKAKHYTFLFTIVLFITRLPFIFSNTLSFPETFIMISDPLSSPIEAVVPYFDNRCLYTEEQAYRILNDKNENTLKNIEVYSEYYDFSSECSGMVFSSNYLGGQEIKEDIPVVLMVSK